MGGKDSAEMIREGFDLADNDFQAKRKIVESLNVPATLKVENGERVVYAQCRFDESRVDFSSHETCLIQ